MIYRSLVFILLSSASCFSFAQVNQQTEEELHKTLLGRFEQIAGGYYVNELCNYLKPDEKSAFVTKVAELNIFAQKKFGSQMILTSQKMGRMGAARKPYSECKIKSKEFFDAALFLVNDLYSKIIKKAT